MRGQRPEPAQLREQLEAVHPGHLQVGDNHLVALFTEFLERFEAVGDLVDRDSPGRSSCRAATRRTLIESSTTRTAVGAAGASTGRQAAATASAPAASVRGRPSPDGIEHENDLARDRYDSFPKPPGGPSAAARAA